MEFTLVAESPECQVDDDLELLDTMMADLAAAEPIWQPTNYWQRYFDETVAELRSGLRDFRRNRGGYLPSFGATDAPPRLVSDIQVDDERAADVADQIVTWLHDEILSGRAIFESGPSLLDVYEAGYDRCARVAVDHATVRSIDELSVSRAGNPFGFLVDGRFLTQSSLSYYLRYAYVASHADLAEFDTVVELGSGAGRQAEILAGLHPHLAVVQLDLAPQLYVADRYLTAALPDRVVPYRATRESEFLRPEPGRVTFAGNFRIGDLTDCGRTLFWNAASFGEMEPNVVNEYAKRVTQCADALFLHQCFAGKEQGRAGTGGVLKPVRMPHYQSYFGEYERIDMQRAHTGMAWLIERTLEYHDTFWVRRV